MPGDVLEQNGPSPYLVRTLVQSQILPQLVSKSLLTNGRLVKCYYRQQLSGYHDNNSSIVTITTVNNNSYLVEYSIANITVSIQ